ncbi:hypothetical protein B4Q04_15335 [Zobellia sp. OII3]|nr:hypothetical protein B4Q04_15335 [Zobellia sp. OII3]
MQFSKHEDDFLPAFSVWPIKNILGHLLSNSTKGGQLPETSFFGISFYHLPFISHSRNRNFEFNFY